MSAGPGADAEGIGLQGMLEEKLFVLTVEQEDGEHLLLETVERDVLHGDFALVVQPGDAQGEAAGVEFRDELALAVEEGGVGGALGGLQDAVLLEQKHVDLFAEEEVLLESFGEIHGNGVLSNGCAKRRSGGVFRGRGLMGVEIRNSKLETSSKREKWEETDIGCAIGPPFP
jgi:hypothetical protein